MVLKMNVLKIELQNFRNYKNIKIDKFSNLNIIIGNNGSGKTSILEAIYFASLTKTFRNNNELNLIKKGEQFLKVNLVLLDELTKKNIELLFNFQGKKAKINNNLQKKLSSFISQYKVLLYSPDEIKIIKSSPLVRRTYLNIQISQLNREYIIHLNNYTTLIKNKNDYLKKLMLNNYLDTKFLDVLDEKIIEEGMYIFNCRKKYLESINQFIEKIFNYFYSKSTLKISYLSDFDDSKQNIIKQIKANRKRDILLGMTSFGIHRDDFDFVFNNNSAKDFCSQGIQKLILLSLKLSETKIFIDEYNYKPILLLDDLFSELDSKNKNIIFKAINNNIQVFITTTDLKNIDKKIISKAKIFNLNERKYKQ